MATSGFDDTGFALGQAEEELLAALVHENPNLKDISLLLAHYRTGANKVIIDDLQLGREHDLEQTLWIRHVEVSKLFKRVLRMLEKNRKIVEYRKTIKRYRDFISGATLHYRGFIQTLVTKYGRIPELDEVASKLGSETASTIKVSKESRHTVLLSCYQTLIYLGDLSRYREEASPKECNWSYAIGYYDLAGAIHPASGTSQHQLGVIAGYGGSHLRVTYYFYRSVASEEPDPRARRSLELEMKKIAGAHGKGELLASGDGLEGQAPFPLIMLLHSRLYKCNDLSGDEELENEALFQLMIDLKERNIERTLKKIALINIAAQYFAVVRFQNPPNAAADMHAVVSFLRFNVKMFTMLLGVLREELTLPINGTNNQDDNDKLASGFRKMSVVMRRILPTLRHYSSWLTSDVKIIAGYLGHGVMDDLLKSFFQVYCSTMTLLISIYNPDRLPYTEYLLEEDEETIAFKPLYKKTPHRYFDHSLKTLKQKYHTLGVERNHPNVEMLGRVRDLVGDADALAMRDDVPFHKDGLTAFIYLDEGTASEQPSIQQDPPEMTTSTSTKYNAAPINGKPKFDAIAYLEGHISDHMSRSSSSSVSGVEDTAMENMVNNLVDSEPMPKGSPAPDFGPIGTPPRRASGNNSDFGPIGTHPKVTGNETSYGVIGTPTAQELARKLSPYSSMETSPRPRLPSVCNSPLLSQADQATPYHHPNTAKAVSQRESSQGRPKSSHSAYPSNGHGTQFIDSSISSFQSPSSISMPRQRVKGTMSTHSPRNQPNIWHHERRTSANRLSWGQNHTQDTSNGAVYDGSQFMSSNILSGSTWNGNRDAAMYQTPPNGQGFRG